ncbi:MAG: hypothetical protein ANABAC_0134 [Anaerolineae bacterium]|nr:MAG: hypothetical protein ANABAC_0134 [Anaerolineae bacterium]
MAELETGLLNQLKSSLLVGIVGIHLRPPMSIEKIKHPLPERV